MIKKEKKEPIKLRFKTAVVLIVLFSVIMVGLGVYVQILKRRVESNYAEVSSQLETRKSRSTSINY